MGETASKSHFSDHLFQYRTVDKRRLILSLIITLSVMFVEIIGGIITNSLALISDAGHMFTHSFAIGIGLIAIYISRKPPCHHKTFGLYRAEVLAAFINGIFLLVVVGFIIYESILRFLYPQTVDGFYMLIVAFIGLGVNITSILILRGSHERNISVRSVFRHVSADAISSIGIVIVAFFIIFTGFIILDPIISLAISIIILYWAWGILKESTRILLEIAPKNLNVDQIRMSLKNRYPEIIEIHNPHLWMIIPDMLFYSAFIQLNDIDKLDIFEFVSEINIFLRNEYNIIESTIQVVSKDYAEYCD